MFARGVTLRSGSGSASHYVSVTRTRRPRHAPPAPGSDIVTAPSSRLIALLIGLASLAAPLPAAEPPEFHTCKQVWEMPLAEAKKGRGATLRGAVVYVDPYWATIYLNDPTGGVLARSSRGTALPARGQLVEV